MSHNLNHNQPRVLLIYNYFNLSFTWVLGLVIRIATCGPNHAALLEEGIVKEYVGSSFKWWLKRLLTGKADYSPNNGCGFIETPLNEWLTKTDRKVQVYKPTVELIEVEIKGGYGFFKLNQLALHIIRTKWLLIGNSWNGKSGVKHFRDDVVCSEYVSMRLGLSKPYLMMPVDLEKVRELEFEFEFETEKV